MFYTEYINRIKDVVAKNEQRKFSISKGHPGGAISGISPEQKKRRLMEQKA
jgi:hypothetical protein